MTQKEYTGPEEFTGEQFEIEFARAWLAYVEGGKVGVDPHKNYEFRNPTSDIWATSNTGKDFSQWIIYRWKPAPKRMVTISYKTDKMALPVARTVVAPEVEAPKTNENVWFLGSGKEQEILWNNAWHQHLLSEGRVFLTREDAQAMSDWLATCRKGGQS